jgi:hypothetical protein
LISHRATELGAGSKSRELLSTVNRERLGLHFKAMGDLCFSLSSCSCSCFIQLVCVLGVLEFLIQAETESILSFMADGKVGKDEVASLIGTIQVDHTSDRSTSQNG